MIYFFWKTYGFDIWYAQKGDSKWPFYPLVGGHLTFEGMTFSPFQKGHQQNCQEGMVLMIHQKLNGTLPTDPVKSKLQSS